MKKGIRYLAVTGGILLFLGISVITASLALGANPIRLSRNIRERYAPLSSWFYFDGDCWDDDHVEHWLERKGYDHR